MKKGIAHTFVIFTIFAVLMVGIVIYFFFTQGWPLIRYALNPCWGLFVSDINSFEIWPWEKEKSVDFHFCDVVGELAFVNKEELQEFKEEISEEFAKVIECEPDYASYIIGLPYFEETKSGLKFWLWPKDIWENVVKWWKEKMGGIKPVCKGLEKPFKVKPDPIKGPKTGNTIWCVTFSLEKDGYNVDAKEDKCK
jgi:hypothetical protein